MNMRRILKAIFAMAITGAALACSGATHTRVLSPNGKIELTIEVGDEISYSVCKDGHRLIDTVRIALHTEEGASAGKHPKLKSVKRGSKKETITPPVSFKHSVINNEYNSAVLKFNGGYEVEVRVFDNGAAHRFATSLGGEMNVISEEYSVSLSPDATAHVQLPGGFKTSYEDSYSHLGMNDWRSMATLPALIENPDGTLMLFSESDVSDYPCMFVKGNGVNGFTSTFPRKPVAFGDDGDRSVKILRESNSMTTTTGSRTLPWRYVAIGSGADIIEQTLTCQLAPPNAIGDTSWIKPGQASWEWWNGAMPYGADVDFESGFNMDTYKYFIDFASRHDVAYIIMDEGWAMNTRDPYTPNPDVNVDEIIRYGKEKGVGVFLWLTWLTVENNFDLFEKFEDMGVAGLKIDFMDRSDQWMVNFYERVCKEAAKHHLLIDFHGAFKPAGLEYKYPNLLSYEGVRGMEQMGGCHPDNSVYLPLIRNAVGPMDYTPGAMLSMQPECYRADRPNAASIGTRAYQMALFVLFESGIQMLADNPTLYYRERECTDFITSVPVTWDETRGLAVETGEYVFVAKRKGDTWYIGGMANGKEKHRNVSLPLDFLEEGSYKMTSFADGPNSHQQAMDYRKGEQTVGKSSTIEVKLARNGGYAAVLRPISTAENELTKTN